jgi:hypothetical protein
MALVDLKSDLANFRSNFTTPSVTSQTVNKLGHPSAKHTYGPNDSNLDIDTALIKYSPSGKYTPTSLYPESKVQSTLRWSGNSAPEVNFFDNNKFGATGFTSKFTDSAQTQFIGAAGTSYTYPVLLGLGDRLVSRPLTNSKFPSNGIATLANQLPDGSVFHYYKEGTIASKKFSTSGYSTNRKYSEFVKSIKEQADKSILYTRATETNSPSAIDYQYSKFSLRNESYNPTYVNQPFVVRGIQRKGNETPQYWGFGSRSGFDSGLIRGGIATVTDRIAADTMRIAKWAASPNGLLWVTKQVGLGLTNPKVETALPPGKFARQTRVHTGVASLLSIAGAPYGLHFTTHGIPFVNEVASYENVIRLKQNSLNGTPSYSRLVDLKTESDAGMYSVNRIENGLSRVKIIANKSLGFNTLSGIGGPGSVYGIGYTAIRQTTDTKLKAVERAEDLHSIQRYSSKNQYASSVSNAFIRTNDIDTNKRSVNDVESGKNLPKPIETALPIPLLTGYSNPNVSLYSTSNDSKFGDKTTPGAGAGKLIETNNVKVNSYPGSPTNDINNYITMAYGKIPKNASEKSALKGDFRNALSNDRKGFTGKESSDYTQNLESKYGFGELGKPGADRTAPGKMLVTSSKFGKDKRTVLSSNKDFRGDKVTALDVSKTATTRAEVYDKGGADLIKFYFQDGALEKKGNKQAVSNTMAFRATITGLSDAFTPGWNSIAIMGRPDGAYMYNSFSRNVSFNFTAAALTRSEMIPMWRKLNYLASYTMPDFNGGSRPSGPFMRLTLGDLFYQTPGFIESLSYSFPEDATWDIAADQDTNPDAKQLPMVVDVSIGFTVVGDYRPQLYGRVYSLSSGGESQNGSTQWLSDAVH